MTEAGRASDSVRVLLGGGGNLPGGPLLASRQIDDAVPVLGEAISAETRR